MSSRRAPPSTMPQLLTRLCTRWSSRGFWPPLCRSAVRSGWPLLSPHTSRPEAIRRRLFHSRGLVSRLYPVRPCHVLCARDTRSRTDGAGTKMSVSSARACCRRVELALQPMEGHGTKSRILVRDPARPLGLMINSTGHLIRACTALRSSLSRRRSCVTEDPVSEEHAVPDA